MNANEIIAGRARQLRGKDNNDRSDVHPNDHVNKGQSSNDVDTNSDARGRSSGDQNQSCDPP